MVIASSSSKYLQLSCLRLRWGLRIENVWRDEAEVQLMLLIGSTQKELELVRTFQMYPHASDGLHESYFCL
jgi:hypothetical protein